MTKQILNTILICVMIVVCGFQVTSCTPDDSTELKNRVTALELMIDDIQESLSYAITTGASVTSYDNVNNTITLSTGQVIPLGTSGGGEATNITVQDGFIVIVVGGVSYTLPLISTVNSLVYCPEFTDGIVQLDSKGATVCLLATPALSAEEVQNATFSIADARLVQTRAGEELMKVSAVALEDDLIKLSVIGLGVEPSKTYVVAVKLSQAGKDIVSSDYFYVKVSDDFSFDSEDLVTPSFSSAITDATAAGDFWVATLPDGDGDVANFLGEFNFKDFVTVDGDVTYELAPKTTQNENVQNRYSFFKSCLSSNGSWKMAGRPGTNCSGSEDRPGILIYLKVDEVIKAKVYFKIIDPLADIDFPALSGITGNFEAELYGRDGRFVAPGKGELDVTAVMNEYETEFPIIHNGADVFAKLKNLNIATDELGSLVYNDGEGKLVLGDAAKKYSSNSRGVFWYYRGFMVVVPESLATSDGKYIDVNGRAWSGAEGYGYDTWGTGNIVEYANNTNYYNSWGAHDIPVGTFGITMDEATAVVTFPESYTGWGLRLAVFGGLEYDYGYKQFTTADQYGMIFINRRQAAEDATMPAPFE